MSDRRPPQRLLEKPVPFLNSSGFAIPPGGIVRTQDGETDGITLTGSRPEYPGISNCIINAGPEVANGAKGWGVMGYTPCDILLDDWAGTDLRDFVGATPDSFAASVQDGGLYLVVTKLETPYARVIRVQDRLDNKMIQYGAGASDGEPVKVIIFTSAHDLTLESPGNVRVDKV